MEKKRKPLSTKKPPLASDDYAVIEGWMAKRIMPGILPLIKKTDQLIHDLIPNLQYAVKWGNAYYGTSEQGWIIEVAAYDISFNIVFLNGASFEPQPPLGSGVDSRYLKLKSQEELNDPMVRDFIQQAGTNPGWSYDK